MAKYKVKALSCSVNNNIYRSGQEVTDAQLGGQAKAKSLEKQGFVELVGKKEPVKKGK